MIVPSGASWPNPLPLPPLPIDSTDASSASLPEYEQELAMLNEFFLPSWTLPLKPAPGSLVLLRGDSPQVYNVFARRHADKLADANDSAIRTIFMFYGPPPFDYARLNASSDAANSSSYDTTAGVRVSLNKDTGIVTYDHAPDFYIVGDLLKHQDYVAGLIDGVLRSA